jgi:zinc protease
MFPRIALAATVLSISLTAALAKTQDGVSVPDDLVTSFALDNGMEVVVVEDHRVPVVQHMVPRRFRG